MSARGDLFLGLDVGTQSTKAVLVDVDSGQVVARAGRAYELIEGLPPGHAEQHPDTWSEAVIAVTREVGEGARVRGVGVSGQQHGAVLLGEGDEVLRPAKLWCDTSAAAEAAALSSELGRTIPAGFTGPKLRWSAAHEPDLWARVRRVLLPHDHINLFLTGEFFTEVGDASGTGYLDPSTGAYDSRAMEATAPGLGGLVPPLRPCASPAGELSASAAAALGLEAGIPVSAGGGDNMMSAIGAGATRPGVSVCSLGTSATVFAFSAAPAVDPGGDIASFRASSAGPDGEAGHLPLLCVMNCTEPLEDLRALTGKGHDELTTLARAASMGDELLVPFFMGERVPNLPDATATLTGLRPGSLSPGVLYRAALEGVALNLAAGVERMRGMGIEPEEVRLVGGAARNTLWQEILATTFGVPVRVLMETETAAVGAALQAAAAAHGEPADRIAQAFVAYGGPAVPPSTDAANVERLALLRGRLAEAVAAQRGA
ncbi:xylulokinase [Planctomycetota bacterium]|jgi:xylulokinase|nr:xylulokinase [Planctomycetota bacterium]